MLRSMKDLEGHAIQATDGTIGHAKDLYFDDDEPVSRQHEIQYLGYFNYPYYWGGVAGPVIGRRERASAE